LLPDVQNSEAAWSLEFWFWYFLESLIFLRRGAFLYCSLSWFSTGFVYSWSGALGGLLLFEKTEFDVKVDFLLEENSSCNEAFLF